MSWEYSKYEAKCENCGKNGFCIQGADDWNRSSTNWLGFINMAPSVTEVARKRADSLDSRPVCGCGKGTIVVGKFLGNVIQAVTGRDR